MNNIEILRSGFSDSLDILKTVVEVVLLTVRKEKIKDKKATAPYIKNILKRCYL